MNVQEVAGFFRKSRRTIMRMIKDGDIPPPSTKYPMGWDAKVIKAAYRKIQDDERHRGDDDAENE